MRYSTQGTRSCLLEKLGNIPSYPRLNESPGRPILTGMNRILFALLLLAAACVAPADTPHPCLLRGGTILSMKAGDTPFRGDILLRDGKIAAIAPHLDTPAGAREIDVSGRYVLPGFIDMHAHVTFLRNGDFAYGYDLDTSRQILAELLRYGVTTVRNPAAPPEQGVALRNHVAVGRVPGPDIVTAGLALNGRNFPTVAAVEEEVARECAIGVDYIKIYAGSTPDLTGAAIAAAHRCGIKAIGHLQTTDWPNAARQGIDFLTHAVSWSASALQPAKRAAYEAEIKERGAMKARITWLESVDVDEPEMKEIVDALVEHRISVDPTLIAYATKFVPMGEENLLLAPQALRDDWKGGDPTNDWSDDDFARMKRAWPKMLAIVRRYYEAGVLLTTGSDLPNIHVVPGGSLHQEMELLAGAGIPAADVLAMATRNGAEALGKANEIGTVETGKIANLVVLERNPLDDIRNTRSIDYVFHRGAVMVSASAAEAAGRW